MINKNRRLTIERLESRIVLSGTTMPETPPEGEGSAIADFLLDDVNPASPRFGEAVSPRDYTDDISAWYFGQAT